MQRLICKCPCGGYAGLHAVMVDDKFQLIFSGQCLDCLKIVDSSVALTELYKMSMCQRKGRPIVPPLVQDITDKEWLKSLGIKEEENE